MNNLNRRYTQILAHTTMSTQSFGVRRKITDARQADSQKGPCSHWTTRAAVACIIEDKRELKRCRQKF